MLGAIIGDIVGSRWEFHPTNDYNFTLFSAQNNYTDDTVCTIAVADALLRNQPFGAVLHDWCRKYPHPMGGYGGRFQSWVMSDKPQPYESWGNGSAMRVSPIAWFCLSTQSALDMAEASARCTHNHLEGIKGAQAVVLAIHDCRKLHFKFKTIGKEQIAKGLQRAVDLGGYNTHLSLGEVQNRFDESCQGTVPVAFWIISQSSGFEDALRRAVSLGADADTLGAIVGSIAEVIWGIPEWIKHKALSYLPAEMKAVLRAFRARIKGTYPTRAQYNALETNKVFMLWKLALGDANKVLRGENGLPPKTRVAQQSDWKTAPMPKGEDVSQIDLDIPVRARDMEILRKGHIPQCQEDHWMMVCDNEYIRYYRSWTGDCAFEAHYYKRSDDYHIDRLLINQSLVEFGVNGDIPATYLFRYLITAEVEADAEKAWQAYLDEWEREFFLRRPPMAQVYRKPKYTPEHITTLKDREVFVFGSNREGRHGSGGASRTAIDNFGAIWGQGKGMQGQCYAIPTMNERLSTIRHYVAEFIRFAQAHQDKVFLVTRIGCGYAGYSDEDIAPLFKNALPVENIVLPRSFVEYLQGL